MRTPEGRDGVVRVVIATPVGVQVHRAGVGIAVHVRHVLPLLVVVLGDASRLHFILPKRCHWARTHPNPEFYTKPVAKHWLVSK